MNEGSAAGRRLLEGFLEVHRRLERNLGEQARVSGLSIAQLAVVRDVGEHPGTSLQDVCDRLASPKSTVSRLVDELVRLGHVLREIPDDDRRSVRLSLDESGACLPFQWNQVFRGVDLGDPAALRATLGALDVLKRSLGD